MPDFVRIISMKRTSNWIFSLNWWMKEQSKHRRKLSIERAAKSEREKVSTNFLLSFGILEYIVGSHVRCLITSFTGKINDGQSYCFLMKQL